MPGDSTHCVICNETFPCLTLVGAYLLNKVYTTANATLVPPGDAKVFKLK